MPSNSASSSKRKIKVRKTEFSDAVAINSIVQKCYPVVLPYPVDALRAQINHFPEGQFVVDYEGTVVGFCITMVITEANAIKPHTWKEITGSGYASRHDPLGDYLYGIDICVDPTFRGRSIGSRLYDARRKLCQDLGLKGIIFGARMPGFIKKKKQYATPEKYLEAIRSRLVRDPTITFQMRNDFEPVMILRDYLPSDKESEGFAVLMRWQNPLIEKQGNKVVQFKEDHKDNVRVCTINFEQRRIASFEEFLNIVEYFIDVASEYSCDFVVFPEFVTMSLLSIVNKKLSPVESLEHLGEYTEPFIKFMSEAAVRYNINIIGGTHIMKNAEGHMQNVCHVFLRDGSSYSQAKIQPTPSERDWWDIKGGDKLSVINTDRGPIGILVCYDAEFPELSRYLADQGAKIIFVPMATDTKQGYLRVRYCCMARTIENQCYYVLSGNTGNLPRVHNMDINYGQSCILTPSDFPFARDGVAADTNPNVEMVAIADLSMGDIVKARNNGTVRNLKDRRHDLYRVTWLGNFK
jgi:predicted amidohydrolase/ribosomal protein S18 acetylase RimI-like enzyme